MRVSNAWHKKKWHKMTKKKEVMRVSHGMANKKKIESAEDIYIYTKRGVLLRVPLMHVDRKKKRHTFWRPLKDCMLARDGGVLYHEITPTRHRFSESARLVGSSGALPGKLNMCLLALAKPHTRSNLCGSDVVSARSFS